MMDLLLDAWGKLGVLVPAIIAAAAVSGALSVFLHIRAGSLWVDSPDFKWLGLYYGLGFRSCVCFSAALIKLILVIYFLAAFREMDVLCYMLFVIVEIISLVAQKRIKNMATGLIWFAVEAVGLFAANMVCSFIKSVRISPIFYAVYWSLAAFVGVFALYVFLNEIDMISERNDFRLKNAEEDPDEQY